VVRSTEGVHRSTGPWTETVHAFLRHLESVGFDGAPRVVGFDDQGREVLSFIEGEVLMDPAWEPGRPGPWPEFARSEECLVETGRLLARFHAASASFAPDETARWRQHDSPLLGEGQIVCHGDVGPYNTVYRGGMPVAFIDWDAIRPGDPIVEFGAAAWQYVPLGSDAYFAASDFGRTPDLSRRLRLFATAYGIDDADTVAWALHQARQRSVEAIKYWPLTPAGAAEALRRIADELDWLQAATPHLTAEF
jgi:hypothetical protein